MDGRTNGLTDQWTDGRTNGRAEVEEMRIRSSILAARFGQPIRALGFDHRPITAEIVQRDVVGIENLPLIIK